jgi:flavorubredoxin/NADPH-dependent 2,4-dienoyl-CoA reductase/sulfur reductase-like enzyme
MSKSQVNQLERGMNMKALQLKENLYFVGVQDPNLRVFDIIMNTEFGTTYNSYLLKSTEKTVLFESAKAKFSSEYIKALEDLVDPKSIDYLVVSHTEPDHAGSIELLLEINPNLQIVATATAIGYLKHIVNRDFYSIPVKEGATISLGDKTLQFYPVPNLHWPDTMFTYIVEDETLVTCDAFGSHYSHEGILKSTVTDETGYLRATKYYFDNILGPFRNPFLLNALNKIKDLPLKWILPGHGPVLDTGIDTVMNLYREWSQPAEPKAFKKVVIPYVSAYGYTKVLAEQISKGITDSGDIEVTAYDMVESDPGVVTQALGSADGFLFGTPTILGEALKPIWDLSTNLYPPIHQGKLAAVFGSYGWSGEGVPHLEERLRQVRLKVLEGFRVRFKPNDNQLTDAYEFGYNFGCVLQNKPNERKESTGKVKMVRCLICGEVFPEGTAICPVCGVGPENFVSVEVNEVTYRNNSNKSLLVLGGGIAGLSAAKAFRDRDQTASITILTNEEVLPYNRPMLTKNMFASQLGDLIGVYDSDWYEENRIEVKTKQTIVSLDPGAKRVQFSDGSSIGYDTCIYTLGSRSFVPPFPGSGLQNVFSVRSLADVQAIQKAVSKAHKAVVIGGGVLGLEAAWELKKEKLDVTVVETLPALLVGKIAPNASQMIQSICEKSGVRVIVGAKVEGIQGSDSVTGVILAGDTVLDADLVIVSTGVRANIDVAQKAGIEVGRSLVVDAHMQTNLPDIYAAGDCAAYLSVSYCLWSEASAMGNVAGANAAGDPLVYEREVPAVTLSAMGTDLYAIGDNGSDPAKKYKTASFQDDSKQSIATYFFVNNRLVGATLLGDTSKLATVQQQVLDGVLFKEIF